MQYYYGSDLHFNMRYALLAVNESPLYYMFQCSLWCAVLVFFIDGIVKLVIRTFDFSVVQKRFSSFQIETGEGRCTEVF